MIFGSAHCWFGRLWADHWNSDADELCRDIAGETAEMHDDRCYQRTEDGALAPVRGTR